MNGKTPAITWPVVALVAIGAGALVALVAIGTGHPNDALARMVVLTLVSVASNLVTVWYLRRSTSAVQTHVEEVASNGKDG